RPHAEIHCQSAFRRRQRGSETLELTLVLLPVLAMAIVLLDTSWAIFAKSTMQRAVRVAVHTGVTLTSSQIPPGSCLTDVVKTTVQQNSLGLLSGSSRRSLI